MKLKVAPQIAFIFILVFGGWYLYREHFIFRGQNEEIVRSTIEKKSYFIINAAKKLDINPRLLASVIYAEWRLNVNLLDSYEKLFASLGNNTSIGLAQIRIATAKWIIDTVPDSSSYYFLGSQYYKLLPKYERREDIVKLLENDSTNCLLAAFHLRQIIERWKNAQFDISNRPDIIATLYSYGLFNRENGAEIIPHAKPRSNLFGKIANNFFYSEKMREIF